MADPPPARPPDPTPAPLTTRPSVGDAPSGVATGPLLLALVLVGAWPRLREAGAALREALSSAGASAPVPSLLGANWMRAAGSVAATCAMLAACLWIGRRALAWLTGQGRAPGSAVFAVFGGFGLLSTAILAAACLGVCRPEGVRAAAILLAAGGVRSALRNGGGLPPAPSRGALAAWGLLALVLAAPLIAPEHNEDCLMYHLALPQQILVRHRLPPPPMYTGWGLPQLADFPSILPLAFGLDAAVRQTGLALLVAGGCAYLTASGATALAAWGPLTVAVAALLPAEVWMLGTAKNDAALAGCMLAAFAALLGGGAFGVAGWRPRRIVLGALLLGGLAAGKLVYAPVAVVALGTLAVSRTGMTGFLPLGACGLAAALPMLPWALRSWIQLGDPLYPFGSVAWPAAFAFDPADTAFQALVRAKLAVTATAGRGVADAAAFLTGSGFLVLLGVQGWWSRRDRRAGRCIAAAVAGALLIGLAKPGDPQLTRFLFPLAVALNLAGLGAWWAAAGPDRGARVAIGVAATVLALRINPVVTWEDPGLHARRWDFALGRLGAEAYRASMTGSYGAAVPGPAREMRGDESVLVVGGKYLWGLPARVVSWGWEPSWIWRAVAEKPDAEGIAIRFRQRNIRWVVSDADFGAWDRMTIGPCRWTEAMVLRYASFIATRTDEAASAPCLGPGYGYVWVSRVRPRAGPARRTLLVLPGADGAFAAGSVAGLKADLETARREYLRWISLLPGLMPLRAILGHLLTFGGRPAEGYAYSRAAAEAGLRSCVEPALLGWSEAANRTGRTWEGGEQRARATEAYRLWTH